MNRPSPRKSPGEYANWFLYRHVRARVWKYRTAGKMRRLSDEEFLRLAGLPAEHERAVSLIDERIRPRLFFHARNRKEFFLNLLTSLQSYDDVLDEADEVVENRFETLGSGLVSLGERIDWHTDFKSGTTWPLAEPDDLDLLQAGFPSDVKVPWELSRFHQVWWLGKAFWLTGSQTYALKFQSLVDDWMDANPPGLGVNWALAMEAAIRAANWVVGYGFFADTSFIPPTFWVRYFKWLYIHGLFIEQNLEYAFVRGNHFLSNVAGLVILGSVLRETPAGKRWFDWGVRQLEVEMGKQVYPDGVDYEKSTAYQRLVLELFYTPTILAERNGHVFSGEYRERLRNMFSFVASYQREDGSIPTFGDADDGRLFRTRRKDDINDCRSSLSVGSVLFGSSEYRRAAGSFHQDALFLTGAEGFESFRRIPADDSAPSSKLFPDGGYAILRSSKSHTMVDVGDIGMEGKGGHGHNDTLSFEYWADGAPIIVDPGTYVYTSDVAARQALRKITSHNTMKVDGGEPAEFAGLWSIRRDRTMPRVEHWSVDERETELRASWFPNPDAHIPVRHVRRFVLQKDSDTLVVDDEAVGNGVRDVFVSVHFHPSAVVESETNSRYIIRTAGKSYRFTYSAGESSLTPAWYSPSYGIRLKTSVLRVHVRGPLPLRIRFVIERILQP